MTSLNINEKEQEMITKQKDSKIAMDVLVVGSILLFSFLAVLCATLLF